MRHVNPVDAPLPERDAPVLEHQAEQGNEEVSVE